MKKFEEKWVPSILKWVLGDAVRLTFRSGVKRYEHTEILHESCFNLLRSRTERVRDWDIEQVESLN